MHIAILMANTDESAFADAHPRDGQKFSLLLGLVRPDWTFDIFDVKDGIFPETLDFDGFLITGSPASVHDPEPWIARLEELIRRIVTQRTPLFGACFGHQIIAKALGGQVGFNRQGWVLGRVETLFIDTGEAVPFYAAHKEQVTDLPHGARCVARTPGCGIAGFVINDHVLTTQYHPEMSATFVAALLDVLADDVGRERTDAAALTLESRVDRRRLAAWIARFFETAAS